MYSIFTYIWLIDGVNVGKYSIHGAYGIEYILYIYIVFICSMKIMKSGYSPWTLAIF